VLGGGGFSGGRKLITPGVAHATTIATVHSSRFMAHPQCKVRGHLTLAKLRGGNPLHRSTHPTKPKELVMQGNPLHQEPSPAHPLQPIGRALLPARPLALSDATHPRRSNSRLWA
jgi:hypothetical protein